MEVLRRCGGIPNGVLDTVKFDVIARNLVTVKSDVIAVIGKNFVTLRSPMSLQRTRSVLACLGNHCILADFEYISICCFSEGFCASRPHPLHRP